MQQLRKDTISSEFEKDANFFSFMRDESPKELIKTLYVNVFLGFKERTLQEPLIVRRSILLY